MALTRIFPGATLSGLALFVAGCAAAPSETRIQGIAVPSSWVESAEARSGGDPSRAQACLSLSRKLWDRDVLESLRYLRRGALLRDAECCRQYLARAESKEVNLSERLYARLFLEGLLRRGAVIARGGEDIRGELYAQLGWAWRSTEPVCLPKSRQVLEAMVESGAASSPRAPSAFLAEVMRETGLRPGAKATRTAPREEVQLYAGEGAGDEGSWRRVPAGPEGRESGDWIESEANAWGGGTDRLFLSANVLAFLVNDQGEPSFRGDRLWICNLGGSPAYLTSSAVGQSNRDLLPGREEVFPLVQIGLGKSDSTTGIPLIVRHRRTIR